MPTRRRSGSRAKTQNRSQAHIWRTPSAGWCASQSSMRECGSDLWSPRLQAATKRASQRFASASFEQRSGLARAQAGQDGSARHRHADAGVPGMVAWRRAALRAPASRLWPLTPWPSAPRLVDMPFRTGLSADGRMSFLLCAGGSAHGENSQLFPRGSTRNVPRKLLPTWPV
jgi:hypothetical protein